MKQEKKNMSNSNRNKKDESSGRGRSSLPGAPAKSNRQTGGNKRHERDDSSKGAEKNTTKKGSNSI